MHSNGSREITEGTATGYRPRGKRALARIHRVESARDYRTSVQ